MSPVEAHADMHEEFDGAANDDLLSHLPAIASLSPAAESAVDTATSSGTPDNGGLSVVHFAPMLPANATAPIAPPSTTSTATTVISAIADNGILGAVVDLSENSTETDVVNAVATVSVTSVEDSLRSGNVATGTDHASPDGLPAPVVGDTTPTSEAPTGDAAAAKKRKQASKKARRRVIEMDN